MSLETALYPSQLNASNPAPSDPKAQGDDHLRTTKVALRNATNGFTGHVLVGGTDTGAANTYVLSPAAALVAYSPNMVVIWMPANTNGGASTINISSLGAQNIRRIDGSPLDNGDIMAGQPVSMVYTGTEFRLLAITPQQITQLAFSAALPVPTGKTGMPLIAGDTDADFGSAFGVAIDEAKGAAIASAATINLTSAAGTGNYTHITGSVQINAMTLPAGGARDLVFDGTPVLTNSANLILPTGANITVQVGDTLRVRGEGAGVARVIEFTRKSGRALVEQTAPGLYLLAAISTPGGTAADFLNVFSAAYDDYLVICEGLSSSAVDELAIRVARNGVVEFLANCGMASVDGSYTATATHVSTRVSTAGNASLGARIEILGANAALGTSFQHILTTAVAGALGGTIAAAAVNGFHSNNGAAGALSGFRLYWRNGATFGATGAIRVYGYRKA